MWKGSESVSGYGSGVDYTRNLRNQLKSIIRDYEVSSILDIACGDCNWIKEFFNQDGLKYVGIDIVKPLIARNESLFRSHQVKFLNLDVTNSEIPFADLVICRDLLFHLPNKEILKVLRKVVNSSSKYLLITTHPRNPLDDFNNVDIPGGDFRRIDLFAKPFFLPQSKILSFEDWMPPDPPRLMVLFEIKVLKATWRLNSI